MYAHSTNVQRGLRDDARLRCRMVGELMSLRFSRICGSMLAAGALAACGASPSAADASLHRPIAISILVFGKATPAVGMGVGATLPLSTIVRDTLGDTLQAVAVLWSSSKPSVLSVDSTGTIVAVADGVAFARAVVAGSQPPVTDSLQVIVANTTASGVSNR